MYGWIVTVARPRIDGVGPNFAVFGQRTLQVRTCKTKVQVCLLLHFQTTVEWWYPPVTEWDGLLPPVSCGDRPIISGVRTRVAYSTSGKIMTTPRLFSEHSLQNENKHQIMNVHTEWNCLTPVFKFVYFGQVLLISGMT